MNITKFNNIEFCNKNINNPNKKCMNFYKSIEENYSLHVGKIIKCPYKFFVYVKEDSLIQSIIFSDDKDYNKIVNRFKYNDKTFDITKVYEIFDSKIFRNQLFLEDILSVFEFTLHDLRYHFSYLLNTIESAIAVEYINNDNKKYLMNTKSEIILTRDNYLVTLNTTELVPCNEEILLDLKSYVNNNNNKYIKTLIAKYEDYNTRLENIRTQFNQYEKEISDYLDYIDMNDKEKRYFITMLSCIEFVNYRIRTHKKYLGLLSDQSYLENKISYHNIHKILYKIRSIMKGKMDKKNIDFNLPYDLEKEYKLTNDIYLALFVIIENAITYSPMNSSINIVFENKENNMCLISISNNGPCTGVSEKEKLFEKGFRGIYSTSKHSQGKGLGLSLVKLILKDNNLDFHVTEKKCKDGQCEFTFYILFKDRDR